MKTAELKVLPVTVLKPAEYNPRKKLKPGDKEYEKIKASIEEFGFADPLVVNSDMTIIGGHQRLTVAIDLGFAEVPCAVVDIDKTREKALNIALNKITGAWDENLLADLLKDIQDSNFDLGFTGFDPPEIETWASPASILRRSRPCSTRSTRRTWPRTISMWRRSWHSRSSPSLATCGASGSTA